MTDTFYNELQGLVGNAGLVEESADQTRYLQEWRGQYHGEALHIVRPASAGEVAAVISACARHRVEIVPQGGNTGLCGGAVSGAAQVLLVMERMNRVRDIDATNFSITVDAGCTLAEAQRVAAENDRYLPLSMSSEGSCQIGGNLSTNAGGVNVLKYGVARDQVLGLEVVLADGSLWSQLKSLRKNTAGYDLKQLFIGAEGTLGVITAATLKLSPQPEVRHVLWASLANHAAVLAMYARARSRFANTIAAFELIPDIAVEFVTRHIAGTRRPTSGALHVLIELHGGAAEVDVDAIEAFMASEIDDGRVQDAVVGQSDQQCDELWAIRHNISEAQRHEGVSIKHDVAVPISALDDFIAAATSAVRELVPDTRIVAFGHVGDGNLHFNLSQPGAMPGDEFAAMRPQLNRAVHDAALRYGGTISAEHGIGLLKRDILAGQVGSLSMALMNTLKNALDPHGLMNPGKVL